MRLPMLALVLSIGLLPAAVPSDQGDGFVPMFNGKDLTGWINVNCAPETFFVKDDLVITTGKPTGYLRTEKQYENFIAEFDWMHVPPRPTAVGNSGFFVWADPIPAVSTGYTRGIEVQVLVNLESKDEYTSQGDLFSIWGATCVPDRPHPKGWARCLPSENRCKGANEWNHYRVVANDGAIKLEVNGKEVSGVSKCNPRKGYLALESEGSECRFKNLKIKELPSTNPKPAETADVANGLESIFTGLDFRGWQASDEHKKHWKASDGVVVYDGKCAAADPHLWTAKEYGNFEMVAEWRWPGKKMTKAGKSGIMLRGSTKCDIAIGSADGSGEIRGYRADANQPADIRAACAPKVKADKKTDEWNRIRINMKDDRVTVFLNDQLVIDNARLPGVAKQGRIGLQHLGDAVQFRNLFVREIQ